MLEELFNLVKGEAQQSVINNTDVPNEQNDEIVAEATNTVASGLRNVVAGGGVQNLLSLFGKGGQQQGGGGLLNNPIVNMMIGHFADKLMNKYKLGGSQASSIAGSLIPNVLNGLVNRTNDPSNNGFSLDGLLNSITGGQSTQIAQQHQGSNSGGGLADILGQLGGSGGSGGGLMDIVSQLAGGAQSQQQKNGGGGLMDIIKGFIK
ncbi:MAG: hypothetical protein ABI691_08245 [Ginsengibacter sp.]